LNKHLFTARKQAFRHWSEIILQWFKCRTTAPYWTVCENTFNFHWTLYTSKTSMIMMGCFKLES